MYCIVRAIVYFVLAITLLKEVDVSFGILMCTDVIWYIYRIRRYTNAVMNLRAEIKY